MTTEELKKLAYLKESLALSYKKMNNEHDRVNKLRSDWIDILTCCFSVRQSVAVSLLFYGCLSLTGSFFILPILEPFIGISFFYFLVIFLSLLMITSISSTFFLEKINEKEKKYIDKELSCYYSTQKLVEEKKDEYEKHLFHLDSDFFHHIHLVDFSLLTKYEKAVIDDYKIFVLDSEDGKLFTTFNKTKHNISIKNL